MPAEDAPPASRVVPCAGAVVLDGEGRLLVVQRGREPARGRWSLPGGRVEPGETTAQAAVREVAEETGLRVAAGPPVGRVRFPGTAGTVLDVVDHAVVVLGGTLRAGDDAADVRWVTRAELADSRTDRLLELLDAWGVWST